MKRENKNKVHRQQSWQNLVLGLTQENLMEFQV